MNLLSTAGQDFAADDGLGSIQGKGDLIDGVGRCEPIHTRGLKDDPIPRIVG